MKKLLSLFLVVAMLASMVGCAPQKAEAEPVPVPAQEKPFEGTTLNVQLAYGGADKSFAAFTEKTGIKIEFVEISTGKALAKLQAENGNTTADVWFGGGVDSYIAGRDLGYLEQYASPEAAKINPLYKDKEGYWTGLALVPAGFIVNNDILKEKGLEAPKTWADLADPKYKDEISMASPAISGTNYAVVASLIQAWGEEKAWDYIVKLNSNVPFYAKSGGEPLEKVAAGEFAIGIVAITGGSVELEKTNPVKVLYPEDIIPWTPAPIAIFKNSKNKDAAKIFVDYMLSEEGQIALSKADPRVMAREGVPIPTEIGTVDAARLVQLNVEQMGKDREAILNKWGTIAGDK